VLNLISYITAGLDYKLQETWHISLPFVTTGPGTELACPGEMKLLNWSGPVFVDHSNSSSLWQFSIKLTCSRHVSLQSSQ